MDALARVEAISGTKSRGDKPGEEDLSGGSEQKKDFVQESEISNPENVTFILWTVGSHGRSLSRGVT